jgi:hypothetical protein
MITGEKKLAHPHFMEHAINQIPHHNTASPK